MGFFGPSSALAATGCFARDRRVLRLHALHPSFRLVAGLGFPRDCGSSVNHFPRLMTSFTRPWSASQAGRRSPAGSCRWCYEVRDPASSGVILRPDTLRAGAIDRVFFSSLRIFSTMAKAMFMPWARRASSNCFSVAKRETPQLLPRCVLTPVHEPSNDEEVTTDSASPARLFGQVSRIKLTRNRISP